MKLLTATQLRAADSYTIENEPVLSFNLMERAARGFFRRFTALYPVSLPVMVFAGTGNNGGDAIAIARMLLASGRPVRVYQLGGQPSSDLTVQLRKLRSQAGTGTQTILSTDDFPVIAPEWLVIDGLFGSGINRPVEGLAAALIRHINASGARVVAIDLPSGLFPEDNGSLLSEPDPAIVRAAYTLTFEMPFLSFFFPASAPYIGGWEVVPIGLSQDYIDSSDSPYSLINRSLIAPLLLPRPVFSHKGHFGHALLVAGSYGKTGAAILASRACMRAGVGLLTTHVPARAVSIMQTAVPEAMVDADECETEITEIPHLPKYTAIGVGPGIGKSQRTAQALEAFFSVRRDMPLVLDADALNILAADRELLRKLPSHTILTPHPGEMERLLQAKTEGWELLQRVRSFSSEYQLIVVLKGAWTAIVFPDGRTAFNPTGNPGMATAGSGDVLTGIILALLASGVTSEEAALLGVYVHGLAGDLALQCQSPESLVASDITQHLGKAFASLR